MFCISSTRIKPGFKAPTRFSGSPSMIFHIQGNCFNHLLISAVSRIVLHHSGDQSGISRWFQHRFREYDVMTSVINHIYANRMLIGCPASLHSSILAHNFSTSEVMIGWRRTMEALEKKGFRAWRRIRWRWWETAPNPVSGVQNWAV